MNLDLLISKWKLPLLKKNKHKYLTKLDKAFHKVRNEIIDYLKSLDKPTPFAKYLSTCMHTTDLITFLAIMEGIIHDSDKANNDKDAIFAKRFCKYVIFRIHWLSNFTLRWTNIKVQCEHCKNIISVNFCYTNNICPICGAILPINKGDK